MTDDLSVPISFGSNQNLFLGSSGAYWLKTGPGEGLSASSDNGGSIGGIIVYTTS